MVVRLRGGGVGVPGERNPLERVAARRAVELIRLGGVHLERGGVEGLARLSGLPVAELVRRAEDRVGARQS